MSCAINVERVVNDESADWWVCSEDLETFPLTMLYRLNTCHDPEVSEQMSQLTGEDGQVKILT